MNCGTFRDGHAEYVDGALNEQAQHAMQQHAMECRSCAAHDAAVRRALLLFRNMPTIEPSSDFTERLEARIRTMGAAPRRSVTVRGWQGALMAAGILVMAVFGAGRLRHRHMPTYALAPVVVSGPDMMHDSLAQSSTASPLTSPTLVTTVSTGNPMWSAAMLAQQVSERFAASAFKTVNLRR